MTVEILLLLAGLVLVLVGAEAIVDGASALARRWGISEFIIGLTIVAIGTSAPEMVVSFISAAEKNSDMAVGNIIGSNIFNTALILGLSAIIAPVAITRGNLRRDIPVNIGITALLILLGLKKTIFGIGENGLSRVEGIVFLALFAWYMITSFVHDKDNLVEEEEEEASDAKPKKLAAAILYLVAGILALVYGGRLFVNHAQTIAEMAGLSDKFIAITVLAAGTSLPELATSCIAAAKGKGRLALGNVLGSNTFNILLILGGSAVIHPLNMDNISFIDYTAVFMCALSLVLFSWTGMRNRIDRLEGVVLVLLQVLYFAYLFLMR
ncbi:MAG: calcium/sodium antiporter [Bacteroidales bacterium]|nr:calcium/sodium antiporter [Bacteroidales bacterium]MBR6423981.1 calcium/sodium antiporter [Bacteroidales bacterium]